LSSHDPHASNRTGLPGPGESVGGYTITGQVGQGGMAVVFEARHKELGKRVAVKMLLPHHAARSDIARRFIREGEAAAKLSHPHAVDVTDVGKDARGAPYLVMEFLEGEDLSSLLERVGKLSVEQTADILVPVISAIGAAHDLGIVHRDLKPQNIFLARRRQEVVPKVVDFGISKIEAESMKLTNTEALLGTPYYMSPEQAQGGSGVDSRTDQFAIGVMLYECVTGKRPFDGGSLYAVLAQIIHGTPTPPSKLVALPDGPFESIVARALHKDPNKRYRDVRSFGAALIKLASFRTQLTYGADFGVSVDANALRPSERPSQSRSSTPRGFPAGERSSRPARSDAPARPAHDDREVYALARVPRVPLIVGSTLLLLLLGFLTARLLQEGPADRHSATPAPAVPVSSPSARAPEGALRHERSRPPELPVPTAEYQVTVQATPASASLTLDAQPAETGRLSRTLRADGAAHTLHVAAQGYQSQTIRFVDDPPPAHVTLVALAPITPTVESPPQAKPAPLRTRRPPMIAGAPANEKAGTSAAPSAPPEPPSSANPARPQPDPKRYGTNGAPILR